MLRSRYGNPNDDRLFEVRRIVKYGGEKSNVDLSFDLFQDGYLCYLLVKKKKASPDLCKDIYTLFSTIQFGGEDEIQFPPSHWLLFFFFFFLCHSMTLIERVSSGG
jgi:hypothetical protein